MVESKNNELVVLMKLYYQDKEAIEFIPSKVIEGDYIEYEEVFVNYKEGNTYFHITEPILAAEFNSYHNISFFALRESKEELKKEFPDKTINEIKKEILNKAKEYKYFLSVPDELSFDFRILKVKPETGEYEFFNDKDMDIFNIKMGYNSEINELEESLEEPEIIQQDNKNLNKNNDLYTFNPYELATKVKEDVLGQDDAIDKVVQSLWSNYFFMDDEEFNKENILLIGSSGVGKTAIFNSIEKALPNIAVHIADLSSITETGIVGDSLEDIIKGLLLKCIEIKHGQQFINLEKASHSIVVLDEFDKIALGKGGGSTDVGNEPVQQELLKIIEGKEMLIKLKLNGVTQTVPINTKYITFACCGAFEGINKSTEKNLGFGKDVLQNNASKSYKEITDEDFKKYGFITELVGRIPSIITLNELELDTLIRIIKMPRRNLFIKKLKMLKSLVQEVEIKEELYEEIAKNAIEKKTGARGLDKVSVDLFSPILNEVCNPQYEYQYAMLDKNTVKNPKKYELTKTRKG